MVFQVDVGGQTYEVEERDNHSFTIDGKPLIKHADEEDAVGGVDE